MTNKNGATVEAVAPQHSLSVTTGKATPMDSITDPVVAGLSPDQLSLAAGAYFDGVWNGSIEIPEPVKTAEQIAMDEAMNGVGFAGWRLQSEIGMARDAVDRESNPIALIEFDHDLEEAIEKLTALRAHAVARVNGLRNLPLSLVA